VKKLLIIQKDEAYFLYETLQVIEKNITFFKDYELSILVNEQTLKTVYGTETPLIKGLTFLDKAVIENEYDVSVNLSLQEETWEFHAGIHSLKKLGFYRLNGELRCDDLWSCYLLTLKARSPFLTFHLQDIYKNILGIKSWQPSTHRKFTVKTLIYGSVALKLFSSQEQENFLQELSQSYPDIPIKDICEIDLLEDVSGCLYIGPATLSSLRLADAGAKCFFLTSSFQGFNLLPRNGEHLIVSTRGSVFRTWPLIKIIEGGLKDKSFSECPYSIYKIDTNLSLTSYLTSQNHSDDLYPFYQSHVVLWSFLLSLSDLDLDVIKCTEGQLQLLQNNYEVLSKFLRLHDYAMVSIGAIHDQAKSSGSNPVLIDEHIKTLTEIEKISDQIAESHPLLRPFLDYYRIRRGQNIGATLCEQSQHSLLTYAEEHQALKALQELFSVTLRKNEVSI
jgi:hypothetical protein